MPWPWQKKFWPASMSARWARERAEAVQRQHVLAEMVLAGWEFREVQKPYGVDDQGRVLVRGGMLYETYDPEGSYHGTNGNRESAALYAKSVMADGSLSMRISGRWNKNRR